MIRDSGELERFEREYHRSEPPDFKRNFQIYEALWEEAVALGILPLKDPWKGWKQKFSSQGRSMFQRILKTIAMTFEKSFRLGFENERKIIRYV